MKVTKIASILLQLLVMLNAFGGGYYAMSGAPGWPLSWLDGSPFSSFFIPGLFLFVVIGGGLGAATIAWLARSRVAPLLSLGMGGMLMAWIVIQVAIIGSVSVLQPIIFVAGVILTALAGVALRRERRAQVGATA